MAEDSQVQSLTTSMSRTSTSPMRTVSIAPQSRTPAMIIGTSALPCGSRTLRRKDGHVSVRNIQSYSSALDPDATENNALVETPQGLPKPGKSIHLSQLSQALFSSNCQDTSEERMVDRASTVSPSTVPKPYSAISSPGLSSLRQAGADISIAMGYSSQNMWDIDTDESENPVEGPVFTRTSNATNTNLEIMALRFENVDLSPKITIRRSPTRSTRLSLRRPTFHSKVTPSIWNPEEYEFNRWPGQETLDRIGSNFTLHRGTAKDTIRSRHIDSSTSTDQTEDDEFALTEKEANVSPKMSYANLSEQQHSDLIHEVLDKECGNPYGPDANDELMKQFHSSSVLILPAANPVRHMHVLNWEAYMYSEDDLVKNALPRLCDAVATVLYLTNPQCLEDFLNPDVEIFEWRRDGHCVMIRREGNEVIVGTYHNFATNYIWTYFVRSSISPTGAWKETFAAVASGITFVSAKGVEFDKFESEPSPHGILPIDEKYALYMGRELGFFLLQKEVWNYRRHNVWTVLWEADGAVTIPKDHDRYQMGSIKEDDE